MWFGGCGYVSVCLKSVFLFNYFLRIIFQGWVSWITGCGYMTRFRFCLKNAWMPFSSWLSSLMSHPTYPDQRKNVGQKGYLTVPRLSSGMGFPKSYWFVWFWKKSLESLGAPTKHALTCLVVVPGNYGFPRASQKLLAACNPWSVWMCL